MPQPPPEIPAALAGLLPRRLCGWALDLGLQAMMAWLLVGAGAVPAASGLGVLPWAMALPILYGTLAIASPLSATPGQALAGLVVRSEDGGAPSPGQALTSQLFYTLSWATAGVALLAPLFSSRRRTLHDLLSGTLVLRATALRAEAGPWPGAASRMADG